MSTTKKKNYTEREGEEFFVPTCRYCKTSELPVGEYKSKEEADEAATMRCRCDGARHYQDEQKRFKERGENLLKLKQKLDEFSEYCAGHGVDLNVALYETIFNAGVAVLDGFVYSATFKFAKIRVRISLNSNDALVIAVSYTEGVKVEV